MSDKEQLAGSEKDVLRVALDKEATQAYAKMTRVLKSETSFVKVQPSAFVSFLVTDFFKTYFEKDLSIFVAEFFDSQSYYESKLKAAKADGNFEQVMSETLTAIKKIKAKAHRKTGRPRKDSPNNAPNQEA